MRNLMYALEQLGGTPACEYTALSGQAINKAVIVQFNAEDIDLPDLGIGINTSSGTTAVYLSDERTINEPKTDTGILKYLSNSTNLAADLKTLVGDVNTLAYQFLKGTTTPASHNAQDGTSASFNETATDLAVTFTDTSVPVSGKTITAWSWNYGDGSGNGNTQNPTHTYANAGTYLVELTVTDSSNYEAYYWKAIAVATPSMPTAPAPAPAPTNAVDGTVANFTETATNLSVAFTDKSTPGSTLTIKSWAWNFGDSNTSTVQNPTHVYAAAGTYLVELTVTDSNTTPQTASSYQNVTVIAAVPTPSPASDGTGASFTTSINGRTVSFTDTSTPASGLSISKWNWNFNDGAGVSNAENPTYTYQYAGTYTVELDVTDNSGQIAKVWNRFILS